MAIRFLRQDKGTVYGGRVKRFANLQCFFLKFYLDYRHNFNGFANPIKIKCSRFIYIYIYIYIYIIATV